MPDIAANLSTLPLDESANDDRFARDFPGQRALRAAWRFALDQIDRYTPPWHIVYWALWLLAIVVTQLSAHQGEAQWWLLSRYAWWIAPFVLWATAPRRTTDGPWLILPMIAIAWALSELWDLVLVITYGWYDSRDLSGIDLLLIPAQPTFAVLVVAPAFSRTIVRSFGPLALRAAFGIGACAAVAYYGPAVTDLLDWQLRPIATVIQVLQACLLTLACAAGVARLKAGEADRRSRHHIVATAPKSRKARPIGFPSAIVLAIAIMIGTFLATDRLGESHSELADFLHVAGAIGALAVLGLIGRQAWAKASQLAATQPLRNRSQSLLARCGIAATLAVFWYFAIWEVAPNTGSQLESLAQSLSGPVWKLEMASNGQALKFEGDIVGGTAERFEAELTQHPSIKYIELLSGGGSTAEGEAIAKLIRAKRLTTISRGRCDSACTYMFLAGSERWLVGDAELGFHRSSVNGLPSGADFEEEVRVYHQLGHRGELIDQAARVPHWDIWSPYSFQLLDAGLITATLTEAEYESLLADP